jgi:8-oxo-dGTP pyrophosphatase MutT (NUDIX family)
MFTETVTQLERALRAELPGAAAQARLSPVPRREWPAGFNPARIRDAAGLLLVFPGATINADPAEPDRAPRVPQVPRSTSDQAHVVLTVRSDSVRHGGQVALPGGVVEPGESFEQAALREAHEEVALPVEAVRILGALTSLDIPVSGFRLHPILAVSDTHLPLTRADGEVATILEIAVDDLLDPAHLVRTERERDGILLSIPAFHVAGHEIWGATAMVLAEFLTLLGWGGG